MTARAIYKGTYCPINQNYWITNAYSKLTHWLQSTRTWLQLAPATHHATHVLCSAPTRQVGSAPQPGATYHLAAGSRSWDSLRPRRQQQKTDSGLRESMLQLAQGLEGWMLCRAVPKDKEALRSQSIFKNNLFEAHHLTYPRAQEHTRPWHKFTSYTGISNSAQAQIRSPGGGLQGGNTAQLLQLTKVEFTRPQLGSTLKMANGTQLATQRASSGIWATKETTENTGLQQNRVGSPTVKDTTKAKVGDQSLPCLSHRRPALLSHLHT